MTKKEFEQLPFRMACHINRTTEHSCTYINDKYGIHIISRTPYKNGEPSGRTIKHYRFDGNVYQTKIKLLEAIKNIKQ